MFIYYTLMLYNARVKSSNMKIILLTCVISFILGSLAYRSGILGDGFNLIKSIFIEKVDPPPAVADVDYIDKIITPYQERMPFFSDRHYYDTVGDPRLNHLTLIQIPRHLNQDIHIISHKALSIYRLTCDKNKEGFEDWQVTDIKVNVFGLSATLDTVIKKDFPIGQIVLKPGGPACSAPILVNSNNGKAPSHGFEILHQLKTLDTRN